MVPLRTFIAVDIPPTILHSIQQKMDPLQKAIGDFAVRWVPISNFHLTLKFLGDVSPSNIDTLTHILRTEADSCQRFDLHIAVYEVPGGTPGHREQIARELIAVYHPGCNDDQYDQAWEEHWIGEYQAPGTTGPLTTDRDPSGSR